MDPRSETAVVRTYLKALNESASPRGRRTPDWLKKKAETLPSEIDQEQDVLKRLALRQALLDVLRDLAAVESEPDLSEAEAAFVKVARAYSERKGITRLAWREEGVPLAVLKQAGIQ